MADERVILNGVNAVTGSYATPRLAVEDVLALAQGLPIDLEHLEAARAREESEQPSLGLEQGRDPELLDQAGWGILFPHDADPAVREALSVLLDHRKAQAGDLYKEFNAERAYRPGQSANQFLAMHGVAPGPARPERIPYYLLLAGSPNRIPYRVQYDLGVNYAVGRVAFETPAEYASWARAVVDAELRASPARNRQTAFFATQHDDDKSTQLSAQSLGVELPRALRARPLEGWDIVTTPVNPEHVTADTLRDLLVGDGAPAILFTATHGMVFPLDDDRQLSEQGALLCSWAGPLANAGPISRTSYFAAEDVPTGARLDGMITFHFACYGAGTPQLDDFTDHAGKRSPLAPHPFVAALPRTLLAHGVLASVGHVARAWSWSFRWPGAGEQLVCFEGTLRDLMQGHRLGHAMEYFGMKYAALLVALNGELEDVRFGKKANALTLANLWTASNDARNFVIVGDPAVRA